MTAVNTAKRAAHSQAVREMFAGIAGRYDLLNHVLSANIDRRWRRLVRLKMADVLADPSAVVADIACGTGDLSIELAGSASAAILGADFCRPMLSLAKEKSAAASFAIPFIEADAMSLPFADNAFDAVTIAFGLRNLSDVPDGLAELHRILKPGGRLVVLEFSTPVVPGFKGLFDFYFNRILPRIGGVISGSRGAYEYLPDSVSRFPDQKKLVELMASQGFGPVEYTNLSAGIAAIHIGTKQ